MRTCISEETSSVVHVSKLPFKFKTICNICHQPVAVNADSRAFVHVTASLNCPEQKAAHAVESKQPDLIAENTQWHACWKVRPSHCCLMDVNNANTLSLMRHRIKPQNTSMGHVFQHLFVSGFMPIHNQCFGAKHTFVQKGDYCDMRSSVIVSSGRDIDA